MLNEMEECGPVECDKYAFLLGSALRNSDQENFFTVYDSILPQNIPKSQLHWIKERARFIAELPEGEFNEWVVDARSFSLAPGKSKMSRSKPTRVTATVSVGALSDDDDETSGPYHSMSSSSRLHKHGSLTDSGRPATVSRKNSLSSEMSEEARGAYDYYPKRSDSVIDSVKIQDVTSPEYDEAIDVESDKSSVESPRSEDSGKGEYNVTQLDEYGIELKTFHRQGYHASDEDSDGNCHPHKKLYGSRSQAQYGYKRPEEDKEEYERATSFDQSSQIFPRFEVDKNRKVTAVDAGTSFPLSRTEPSLSKSYSTGSRTEEWNLKQKRSRAIDDGVFSGFDVNGNPIEKLYSQMRERPLNQEASAFNSGNSGYKSYGATSSDNTLSNPISPQEPSHATENKAKIGNKKGKQKREEPVVLAENVENYQGHKDLEELVKFIEQNDIKENQVKKSNGSSDVKLNDKLVKKAKDKKSKQTVGIVPSVPKPGDHIVIDIELELPPPPTDVMGNSSEKLPPNDEIPNEKIEKNVKPQDCEKSVTQKNKAFIENDVKSKNKTSTKNETTPSDKKPKNTTPGKKEVKEAKVNGFNHGIESLDAGVTKEHDKKVKESTKKTSAANKTPESVNDKKKANKLQIDTVTNDKQMVNCSKSPGEIKSPLPTSPVSTKSEANDFDSGNYIFTDIPVSHVEPEFTIVNKKKKKPIAHVIQSKDQLPFMAGISREFPVTRPKYRENYSQSVPRSVTPPPTKSRDKSQDFSLSAFPALSNSLVSKDKSNPLEARRSSIGDLPLAGETSSLDDSDIASVRSLPAAQAGRLLELASSRFQKSYANIAASSKPVGQSSPDTSYEECSGESPEKPKQTVWKGSLTERRHSIGSSPDDGKLLESSSGLTDSSRQKSGSQEVIKTENNPTSKTSDTANINLSPSSGVSKQKPYHQDIENSKNQMCDKLVNTETETTNVREGSVPHQPAEPNNQSELSQSTMSSSSVSPSKYDLPIQPFDVSRFDRKSTNKTTASSSAHAVVNRSPVSFTGNSVVNMRQSPGRNEQVETSVSSVNIKSSSPLSSNDMRSQSVVSLKSVKNKTLVPKIPTNGRKNKSVVFLDKRDVPSNLDITFGFDDITESRPTLTNNIENMSAKNNTTSVKNKSTPKNDPEVVSTNVSVSQPNNRNRETVTTPTYVVNPSDLQPGHVFTQTLLENDKQGGQFVPNYNTVKSLKDHVNLLNGVVKNVGQRVGNQQQTLTNETPNGNRSTVSTLQTNPNEGNVPISHDNQPIVGKEKIMCSPVVENNGPSSTVVVEDKKMVIYYGDAMVNNDDCVHSGGDNNTKSIQFVFSSKNINCGKFNHNEAVTQLKKEWDRVMELKSKNPGSVQVYSSQ